MGNPCPIGTRTMRRSGIRCDQHLIPETEPFTINPTGEMMKHTPVVIYRKSTDGRITTAEYATKHPAKTEREIVYRPSPKNG